MSQKTKLNACRICLGISLGALLLSNFMFIWSYWYHGTLLGPELGANMFVLIGFACNVAIMFISKFGNIWTVEYLLQNDNEQKITDSILNEGF